jgi:hypothetical protein
MKKKILYGVLAITFIGLLVGAYTVGAMTNNVERRVNLTNQEERLQLVQVAQGSDQIAVVNLDVGVELAGGEHAYHSTQAVSFPFDNFQFTSLSEARTGLEDNQFGAYIIIPADFSENVESLNAIPTRILLEYRLSSWLTGEEQRDILYAVLHFGDLLNADLSHMYLSSILTEFHQVQDASLLLMNHDLLTANAIDAIQAGDLVEMIRLPNMERTEFDVPPLDVTGNIELIGQVLSDLSDAYQGNIELNAEQLALLTEQGVQIIQELARLINEINEIELVYDEDGYAVHAAGQQALISMITQFNTNLLEGPFGRVSTDLNTISSQLDYVEGIFNRSITVHNNQLAGRIAFPVIPQSLSTTIVNGNVVIRGGDQDLLTIGLIATPSANVEVGYLQALAATIGIIMNNPDLTVAEAIAAANSNGTFITSNFTSAEALLNSVGTVPVPIVIQGTEVDEISGRIYDVHNHMVSKIRNIHIATFTVGNLGYRPYYFDVDGNRVIDQDTGAELTIFNLFDDLSDFVSTVRSDLGAIQGINVANVTDIVENQVVSPLVDRTTQVKATMTNRQQEEIRLIGVHQGQIGAFSPVSDAGIVGTAMSSISGTTTEMVTNILENNQAYMEITRDVFTNADEFVREVHATIIEATEASHLLVEEGLSEAQELSYSLSSLNREMLEDFSTRLPFTRLGTVEFTTAYEFIVRPMLIHQLGETTVQTMTSESESTAATTTPVVTANRSNNIWLWIIPISIILALIAALSIALQKRNKRKEDDF